LSFGEWEEEEEVMVRVHSSSIAQDTFMSIISSHESVFRPSLERVAKNGKGLILYMNQETKSENFLNILKTYKEKDGDITGVMTDSRDYGVGAQILRSMGVKRINLLTNKPVKRAGILGYGLEIVDTISLS
jgi:3,4-dihydroxy 2-butanone 4-phosphate synthase/GTP cyclohydrolase II